MIRCNNCYRLFSDDDQLKKMQDAAGDWMDACPDCKTDGYLMDMDDQRAETGGECMAVESDSDRISRRLAEG